MHSSVQIELPPAALRPVVACAIRRTLGDHGEDSCVQANGYACLSVTVRGEVHVPVHGLLPARFVSGPFSEAMPTQARGPLLSMSVIVQPWLLPSLVGTSAQAMVDRFVDVGGAASLRCVCEAAADAARDAAGMERLWQAVHALLPASAWSVPTELALAEAEQHGPAAAARMLGVSERHYRRLFVEQMGLAPKLWQRTKRFESALRQLAASGSDAALGELALDAGYADQPHMNRDFRELVQQRPAGVRSGLHGESDVPWSLQPARVRFVQDGEDGGS